ncbi:MAG TPA: hypothetical protein VF113_02230 [Stellaceae bacterium]
MTQLAAAIGQRWVLEAKLKKLLATREVMLAPAGKARRYAAAGVLPQDKDLD